jgi:hypothetical protein
VRYLFRRLSENSTYIVVVIGALLVVHVTAAVLRFAQRRPNKPYGQPVYRVTPERR